jgi:ribose/xylose/arabinose/galactoside ABC-type transport system permease subunit
VSRRNAELFVVDNLIWFINIGLILLFTIGTARFLSYRNLLSAVYSVCGIGFLVYAESICLLSGHFDVSIGGIAAFSATVGAMTCLYWVPGIPWPLVILEMLAVGAIIGLFNGFLIGKIGINPFLQTLGMYILLYGLVLAVARHTLFDLPSGLLAGGAAKLGSTGIPLAIIILVIIAAVYHFFLRKTPVGRRIYAVGSNEEAARACGINIARTRMLVFTISGMFSAVAGLLYMGYMGCVPLGLAEADIFLAFAGTIIGGVALTGGQGKVSGMLGGILLIGLLEVGLSTLRTPAHWRGMINGIVLMAAILVNSFQYKIKKYLLSR